MLSVFFRLRQISFPQFLFFERNLPYTVHDLLLNVPAKFLDNIVIFTIP